MRKNILFLVEADLTSGASKCGLDIVKNLAQGTNYKPIVITQHKFDFNDVCTQNGIENYHFHYARICSLGGGILGWLIAFFCRPILNFLTFQRLKKSINLKEIAFIHSNGSSIDFGAYLYRKLGIPHIWHVRDFFLFDGTWKPLVKNYIRYLEVNATKIITVSQILQKYLLDHGCNKNKIQTIYDGISNSEQIRKQTHILDTKKIIKVACVGQICKSKGQETLIDAISLLPTNIRAHFKFDFFGNFIGDTKKVIKEKIAKAKIGNIIEFKGYSKNVSKVLLNYDIGIQPSHSEGFSRVTAEYMIAGLCVIAANEGAIPELIQNQVCGFLYKDYDSQKLANILIQCYNNPSLIPSLALKAQEKALSNYTLDINLKNLLSVYDNLSKKN